MKRSIIIALAVLLFLAALLITLYPLISNYVNDKYQSLVRTSFEQQVEELDDSALTEALAAAQAYNDSLSPLRYSREAVESAEVDYENQLNPNGSGIMGYVQVPKLDIDLPIYHGTAESVLEQGVGHLIGSSLPIGGEGCHIVLTGHSGVAGKRLFSDLDQLAPGDVFYLRVLNESLAYQVSEINTVLPHETELLVPVAGEDLCTLVTCYPYGVNTHRLLVRGTRIPYEEAEQVVQEAEAEAVPVKSTWKEQYRNGLLIGGGSALAAVVTVLVIAIIRRKRRKRA